jgi:hypothetical protein
MSFGTVTVRALQGADWAREVVTFVEVIGPMVVLGETASGDAVEESVAGLGDVV